MDIYNNFFGVFMSWIEGFLNDCGTVFTALYFSLDIGGETLSLLGLCTVSGLMIYLGVAVIKWIVF